MDHKSHEAMRAYLLGLLSDDQAASLEEEYFVSRALFLRVQSEETVLIADYLDDRLRGREKRGFETRYLPAHPVQWFGRLRGKIRAWVLRLHSRSFWDWESGPTSSGCTTGRTHLPRGRSNRISLPKFNRL